MMRKETQTEARARSAPIYEDLSLQDQLKTVNQRFPRSIQSAFNRAVTKRLDDGIFRGRSVNDWCMKRVGRKMYRSPWIQMAPALQPHTRLQEATKIAQPPPDQTKDSLLSQRGVCGKASKKSTRSCRRRTLGGGTEGARGYGYGT